MFYGSQFGQIILEAAACFLLTACLIGEREGILLPSYSYIFTLYADTRLFLFLVTEISHFHYRKCKQHKRSTKKKAEVTITSTQTDLRGPVSANTSHSDVFLFNSFQPFVLIPHIMKLLLWQWFSNLLPRLSFF